MGKVSVVYHAPHGDSKVVEWGPHTFFDGRVSEVEDNEANAHMLSKIANNRFFEIVGIRGRADPKPKPAPEPEVFPEETSDDDPEGDPEPKGDPEPEDDAGPEKKPPFTDYVPAKKKAADKTKTKSAAKRKHRAA